LKNDVGKVAGCQKPIVKQSNCKKQKDGNKAEIYDVVFDIEDFGQERHHQSHLIGAV
jgi:hypothetical protein